MKKRLAFDDPISPGALFDRAPRPHNLLSYLLTHSPGKLKRLQEKRQMNTTTFVVCGFHQGRKLKPQHFGTEAQAREHALYMGNTIDCVVLTTSTAQSSTRRDYQPRALSRAAWAPELAEA